MKSFNPRIVDPTLKLGKCGFSGQLPARSHMTTLTSASLVVAANMARRAREGFVWVESIMSHEICAKVPSTTAEYQYH